MKRSKIEWTDATWNPVTGCSPAGAGCANCYAKRMHERLRSMGQEKYQHDFHDVQCHHDRLDDPSHWTKPRRVFVCSMSDLFHKKVPDLFIAGVFAEMSARSQHIFQVLTKRPHRMRDFLQCQYDSNPRMSDMLANVWVGTSISTQRDLESAAPALMDTPAAVRFFSVEPMLESIHFRQLALQADWVIIGAESGPHRRECREIWVNSLVTQCEDAGVPCFVKQIHRDGNVVKMPPEYPQEWPERLGNEVNDD